MVYKTVQIQDTVIEVLTEIQGYSGRAAPQITGATCPIGDLEGFDSINAVEATSKLSSLFGQNLNPTIMLSNNPNQTVSVCDIVDRISSVLIC